MRIQDEIRLKNKVLVSANLIPFAVGGKDKKIAWMEFKECLPQVSIYLIGNQILSAHFYIVHHFNSSEINYLVEAI